jgi:hypothetical protein
MNESRILSSLAMADARHDFGQIATQYHTILQESIPGIPEFLANEE